MSKLFREKMLVIGNKKRYCFVMYKKLVECLPAFYTSQKGVL
ncbi:hypothetical protein [Anaerosinus sp.]